MSYLETYDNIDLIHLLAHNGELIVKGVGYYEVHQDEAIVKNQEFEVFLLAAAASRDQVVTAFVYQPMKHPEEKEYWKWDELIDIKRASHDQSKKQEMK